MESELLLKQAGVYETTIFTPNGPAGIFALYLLPGAQTLPRAFLNEFVNVSVANNGQGSELRLIGSVFRARLGYLGCS